MNQISVCFWESQKKTQVLLQGAISYKFGSYDIQQSATCKLNTLLSCWWFSSKARKLEGQWWIFHSTSEHLQLSSSKCNKRTMSCVKKSAKTRENSNCQKCSDKVDNWLYGTSVYWRRPSVVLGPLSQMGPEMMLNRYSASHVQVKLKQKINHNISIPCLLNS